MTEVNNKPNPETQPDAFDLNVFINPTLKFWGDLGYDEFDEPHERRSVELDEVTVVNDFVTGNSKGTGIYGADRHYIYPQDPVHPGDQLRPLFAIHRNHPYEGQDLLQHQTALEVWYRPNPAGKQLVPVDTTNFQDAQEKFAKLQLEV